MTIYLDESDLTCGNCGSELNIYKERETNLIFRCNECEDIRMVIEEIPQE